MERFDNSVVLVTDDKVIIRCSDRNKYKFLKTKKAKRGLFKRDRWIFSYNSKKDLSLLFELLRDEGFAFSGDSNGWPPSSIFLLLREEGYLEGKMKEIIRKDKDTTVTREI